MIHINKVLVVGLGRFGQAVANSLWSRGVDVTVIDREPSLVDALKGRAQAAFIADGTDQSVLESIGARSMDAAIVTFGESFESSVLIVSTLKSLGVTEIVARASTPRRADVLRAVGATRVLEIESEMGVRLAQELLTPSSADLLELASQYRVVPWVAAGSPVGVSLKESNLRKRFGINIIGVRPASENGTNLKAPSPDLIIRRGDICLLVAEDSDMRRFLEESEAQ